MPKINVYLSDELAEAVKAAGLPVSPICQRALEVAVRRVTAIRETAKFDLTEDDMAGRMPNFTDRANNAVTAGVRLARDAGLAKLGTEYILLGMLNEGQNMALQVLQSMEIEPDDVRETLTARPVTGELAAEGEKAAKNLDASAAAAMQAALNEAISLGHNYIGCEHLLLGLIAEPDGIGGEVLRSHGAELRLTKRAVQAAVSGYAYARARGDAPATAADQLREVLGKFGERLNKIEARLDRLPTEPS
ncbi:MAG TPA: Clp protease N-terminal domain-containing protein [Pseudonocardiaceae bacterium]|jgi:ATP-dependent Clp protease ATP-binding subunit ClpC